MPQDIKTIVDELSDIEKYPFLYHQSVQNTPMPSPVALEGFIDKLKAVLFPGYFGDSEVNPEHLKYNVGSSLHKVFGILSEQIKRGLCFSCPDPELKCVECGHKAREKADEFISRLPHIKQLLYTDVIAAYHGDPASQSHGETIFCYPSISAMTHHRIAHELLKLEVPLIPRIISEQAHSQTGIDIHPGAEISDHFFIDHGTGVVIGETCIIGKNVRIYQGVTLGARSFPMDRNAHPIKGIARHPIVEDNVIIYANSTILGRITIGKGAVIPGNSRIMEDVPAIK